MWRQLEDLPEDAQREVEGVLRLIFRKFEEHTAGATQPWKKAGRIVKVILYGARLLRPKPGGPEAHSEFNLLVVVNDSRLTAIPKSWAFIEEELIRERRFGSTAQCGAHLLFHSLGEVNRYLAEGTKFFVDIVRNGVALYEDERYYFDLPRRVTDAQARRAALRYFDFWYPRSVDARRLASFAIEQGMLRDAAFLLHQATERAYHCVLLVLTRHSPRTHRLDLLRPISEQAAPMLARAWPTDTKMARRCFSRLRRAYGQGRYDPDYRITAEEVRWLFDKVGQLQELVRIEKAIECLPRLTREVFRARRLENLDYEAIAERTGLAVEQVEYRLGRALDGIIRDLKRSKGRPDDVEAHQWPVRSGDEPPKED